MRRWLRPFKWLNAILWRIRSVSIAGIEFEVGSPTREPNLQTRVEHRLLAIFWSYPLLGENEASWAVKESAVLFGQLGTARENPAPGVAIVTTEFAQKTFGAASDSRIAGCVAWGVRHAESAPPFRLLVKAIDPVTYRVIETKPDLRHTLAFAVVLARARKHYSYLTQYLQLAIDLQREDGGVAAGQCGRSE